MLDSAPITSETTEIECPACGKPFSPGRKNQAYCSRCCQKKSSQNANRDLRHLENFSRDELEAARARDLREMLYAAPPGERLGVMKDILDAAYHDGGLRNILTRPELLADRPFSAGRGQTNIAKAADDYCRKFLRMSVRSYIRHVRSQLGDNPTGEPLDVHIEVVRDRNDHGPVPKLNKLTMQNVKCIHKVLPEGDHGTAQADLERVDRICEMVEARMAAQGPVDVPERPDMEQPSAQPSVQHGNQPSDKREAKRKIALSQVCFDKGVNIDSPVGKALASSMGIQTL
jgi:hypothetical protein